jgi:hypothetical protein
LLAIFMKVILATSVNVRSKPGLAPAGDSLFFGEAKKVGAPPGAHPGQQSQENPESIAIQDHPTLGKGQFP